MLIINIFRENIYAGSHVVVVESLLCTYVPGIVLKNGVIVTLLEFDPHLHVTLHV